MDSSISRFKWVPVRAVLLLATALATWAICALYSVYLNPEVVHYRQGDAIKRAWTKQMAHEYGSKIIIFGGSSCEFSIDGERLLANYKEPLVNDGRHAGMGVVVLTESVLGDLRRGDTLIVALEPGGLTGPIEGEPSLAVQFSVAVHHPEWVLHPVLGLGRIGWFEAAAAMRPGGYHAFTMLGKIIRRQPMYRYQLSDYHRSGWKETAVRVPMTVAAGHGPHLSDDGRTLLTNLAQWCQTNGVRVAYSLPWSYCPTDQLRDFRRGNAELLAEIMAFIPVLRDRSLGADPAADDFADTGWHLTTSGAVRRTDELGNEIQQWDTWTRKDLDQATADLRDLAQGADKR
jgi:hypothetical protein